MSLSGIFLRFGGVINRILQFIFSIISVGIYAYFVSNIREAGFRPSNWTGAILGISSASAIYTLFGIVFTLCLGANFFFGSLAIILDVAFIGAFIFVAYATRAARLSCSGYVATPLGAGPAGSETGLTIATSLRRACQMETVVFASAIILCILYFMTAIWQCFMVRNRRARTTGSMSKV